MGRIDDARWQLHLADSVTNELALARAATVGLVDMIDRLRFRDADDPIPAPGIYELADAFERHTLEAMHATATCRILVDDLAAADDLDQERGFEAVMHAVTRAAAAAGNAARALRHFVQIGLGIAQHTVADDDTELLERSLIAVLNAHPMRTSATRDAFPLLGRTSCELCVELAGAVSRMLCDQSSGTDPAPVLVLEAAGMVDVVITVTEDNGIDLVGADGRVVFSAPVTTTEVVSTVLRAASDSLGSDVATLTARWRAPVRSA